jgi:predicted Zn finger-like uncharacterized protein
MIEVQCTSCHTRYRIDEQVLPEGTPTFKCSRCGHVFTFEPRKTRPDAPPSLTSPKPGNRDTRGNGVKPPQAAKPTANPVVEETAQTAEVAEALATNAEIPNAPSSSEPGPSAYAPEPSPEAPVKAAQPPSQPTPESVDSPEISVPERTQAQRAEEFYSRLLAEKEPPPDENLSFDFADEEPVAEELPPSGKKRSQQTPPSRRTGEDEDAVRWQVGNDNPQFAAPQSRTFEAEDSTTRRPARSRKGRQEPPPDEPQFIEDQEFVNEEDAPFYNRGVVRSSRFFLLLFLLVGIGFGAMTLLIHNAPAASEVVLSHLPFVGADFTPPFTPARLVALRNLTAAYEHSKDGHSALVVSGAAINVGTTPLRVVQLTAALRNSQRLALASQAVYCGNNVSTTMVSQMTPHEIEFFQKLEPPATFTLEPSGSCPFVAVFMNAPAGVASYDVTVSQAVAAQPETASEPAT